LLYLSPARLLDFFLLFILFPLSPLSPLSPLIRHIYGVYRFTFLCGRLEPLRWVGEMVEGSPSPKDSELLSVVSPHSGVLQELDTDARLLDGLKAPAISGLRPNHLKDQ
jgi:hypothetical protein